MTFAAVLKELTPAQLDKLERLLVALRQSPDNNLDELLQQARSPHKPVRARDIIAVQLRALELSAYNPDAYELFLGAAEEEFAVAQLEPTTTSALDRIASLLPTDLASSAADELSARLAAIAERLAVEDKLTAPLGSPSPTPNNTSRASLDRPGASLDRSQPLPEPATPRPEAPAANVVAFKPWPKCFHNGVELGGGGICWIGGEVPEWSG